MPIINKIGNASFTSPINTSPTRKSGSRIRDTTTLDTPHAALIANTRIFPKIKNISIENNMVHTVFSLLSYCLFPRNVDLSITPSFSQNAFRAVIFSIIRHIRILFSIDISDTSFLLSFLSFVLSYVIIILRMILLLNRCFSELTPFIPLLLPL